jgi:hypothetical protein
MAKLPDEITDKVLNLQKSLLAEIDAAKATEITIFERYGENESSITVLEQLNNTRERLTIPYSRFHTLLLRIAEAYPYASEAMLNLLSQSIEQAEATVEAAKATIREARQDFQIL